MQNFPFYDKPVLIHYAKTKSYCVAKADGSFVPRDKKRSKMKKLKEEDESQQSAGANGVKADTNGGPMSSSCQGKPRTQESAAAPNNILFIENLPHEMTYTMLEMLFFKQYPGFREVRMIGAKPGIAFAEFEDDIQSAIAMEALRGFKITPQNPMVITHAKK